MKRSLFFLVLILVSCDSKQYNTATIPLSPVNLGDINSAFDDYNSESPNFGETSPLCFSTNRANAGKSFDIIFKLLDITVSHSTGKLTVAENTARNLDVYLSNENINDALVKLNTSSDEFGPYLISQGQRRNGNNSYESYVFLFSSDFEGNQDIKFLHNLNSINYTQPQAIAFLNSPQEDAYPTITSDSSSLYFCSNRKGDFNIYKAALNQKATVLQNLEDSSPKDVLEVTALSSEADDKCPLIVDNVLVFVSNRAGGFGGFDLYYSILKNGEWSAPINFGDKINTQYDEYRPFIKPLGKDFTNDFMIFSSNRPGGKGGFDLYYVGVPKADQFGQQ